MPVSVTEEREVLGSQLGAISRDVSNQNKEDVKHAHIAGLSSS